MADIGRHLKQSRAEEFVWGYLEQLLEEDSQPEAARSLRNTLRLEWRETQQEQGWTTHHFDIQHRVSDCFVKLNAVDGSVMGWYFELLAQGSDNTLVPAKALSIAEIAARPPKSAVLETAGYEEIGGQYVFLARWKHEAQGVPVERDFIQVMVNGKTGKVFSLFKRWHKINYDYSER